MDVPQIMAIALASFSVSIPLMIAYLTPAKPTVNHERIARLMRWLVAATAVSILIVAVIAYFWPAVGPMLVWSYMPLFFGLTMPIVLAKRPPSTVETCPVCNYSLAGMKTDDIVRCPECGRTSRRNKVLPIRVECPPPADADDDRPADLNDNVRFTDPASGDAGPRSPP